MKSIDQGSSESFLKRYKRVKCKCGWKGKRTKITIKYYPNCPKCNEPLKLPEEKLDLTSD
jgi:hypothetical protein